MKRLHLVEPVVALYAFSYFLIYPLVPQYVYRRLWEQLTHTPYPVSDNTSRCAPSNSSSNHTDFHKDVQKQASLFSLYSEVLSAIPSLIVTLVLVTYSDRGGRKISIIMPLIGTLIYATTFLILSFFELNIYLLIGASFLSSLFGDIITFLGGCLAYIADLCHDDRQKTLRIAGVDLMIGLLSGVAAISAGYFLRAEGFNWPFLTSALCQCLILIYAVFILEETVKKTPVDGSNLDRPQRPALTQLVFGLYQILARASSRCKRVLVVLLFIFTSYSFAYLGGTSLVTLYELNEPLCWTEILIGYGSAASTTVFLTSFAGVSVFTYCGVPKLLIVMLGILSAVLGFIMVAFAKTTVLMFLGALFASLSFLESLFSKAGSGAFNSIYAATVGWYPGFAFLLAAGLLIIPLSSLGAVAFIGLNVTTEPRKAEDPTSEEDGRAENDNDSSPLLSPSSINA
ncbi:lysosomal proton-coupled steroid conjugate and bile acid symporter SLC46A3-like isoform 2-T2 [Fundulus diaphanus]